MDHLEKRGYRDFVRIDSGGQANVYSTNKDGRRLAVKVVKVDLKENEPAELDEDLKRELYIIQGLRHPNTMQVEECFRTMNRVYIVMPFMPNGSIGNFVRERGPLCEWNCKVWFPPIARAIRYLHRHMIAHR